MSCLDKTITTLGRYSIISWQPRRLNREADAWANLAMDFQNSVYYDPGDDYDIDFEPGASIFLTSDGAYRAAGTASLAWTLRAGREAGASRSSGRLRSSTPRAPRSRHWSDEAGNAAFRPLSPGFGGGRPGRPTSTR